MARRKTQQPDRIEQSIRLTADVTVTICASESVWAELDINWRGKSLSISASGQAFALPDTRPASIVALDTPEVIEARRKLEERFPKAATPFRTEDVDNPLGVALDAENLMRMAGPLEG